MKQLQVGIETCLTTAVPPVLDVMETLKEQIKDEINKYHALLSSSNTSESSSSAASTGSSNDESDKAAKVLYAHFPHAVLKIQPINAG